MEGVWDQVRAGVIAPMAHKVPAAVVVEVATAEMEHIALVAALEMSVIVVMANIVLIAVIPRTTKTETP